MRLLIAYICKSSDAIVEQLDRFPIIYSTGLDQCKKTADQILGVFVQTHNPAGEIK